MKSVKLIIKNLEQIVQVCDENEQFKRGVDQDKVAALNRRDDGIGLCVAVDFDGKILDIGYDDVLLNKYKSETVIDGENCSLIPGLIDTHTHPVWSGDRCFEFDMKLRGHSYIDIHNKGGGIYFTVNETRKASVEMLSQLFIQRLTDMLNCGTCLVEAKTGYGLDFESELKLLTVIDNVRKTNNIKLPAIMTTYLGAHAVPKGMSADEGKEKIIEDMERIHKTAPHIKVDFIDVFCEKGVYDIEQTREILLKGKKIFQSEIAFHGDELSFLGAGELGGEINAKSISHLEYVSEQGIKAMAKSKTVAIICPITAYLLKLKHPPIRNMIAENVIVSIASDFNPNAFCYSLPSSMNVAVVNFGMTINEALVATTINAAYAVGKSNERGSIEIGKIADLLIINASDWRHLVYRFGDTRNIFKCIIREGEILK